MNDTENTPRKLPKHHIQWWEVLQQAIKNDDAAIMSCGSPDGDRTVICIVQRDGDNISFTPVAQMTECDNPFDCYTPPKMSDESEG